MRNVAELEARVLAAADPLGASYGSWLTQAEVNSLVAPRASARSAVRAWATSTGATCVDYPSSVRCTATVAQTSALLNAAISAFQDEASGRVIHRVPCGAPVPLPALQQSGDLLFLTQLFDFPPRRRAPLKSGSGGGGGGGGGGGDGDETPVRLPTRRADSAAPRSKLRRAKHAEEQQSVLLEEEEASAFASAAAAAAAGSGAVGDARKPLAAPVNGYFATVETFEDLYDLRGLTAGSDTVVGVVEALSNGYSCLSARDVAAMAAANGLEPWRVVAHGPLAPLCNISYNEAELDVQYLGAIARGATQVYWAEPLWMYDLAQTLLATPDARLPQVLSISYGGDESGSPPGAVTIEGSYESLTVNEEAAARAINTDEAYAAPAPRAYIGAANAAFAALTARGVTLVASSGDTGAPGDGNLNCADSGALFPQWPASSPWVLSVGATSLAGATSSRPFRTPICALMAEYHYYPGARPAYLCATAAAAEVACSTGTGAVITSGGGFSAYAPQPAWQRAAVAAYIASGTPLPPPSAYNASNRAYPDVSALGHNVLIWQAGAKPPYLAPLAGISALDGTSISAPVWAGIIGLINARRAAAGKPAVGFVNPAIYHLAAVAAPHAWRDVTVGNNKCTEANRGCDSGACEPGCEDLCPGYEAAKGWDPVTGWGTPHAGALLDAFAEL